MSEAIGIGMSETTVASERNVRWVFAAGLAGYFVLILLQLQYLTTFLASQTEQGRTFQLLAIGVFVISMGYSMFAGRLHGKLSPTNLTIWAFLILWYLVSASWSIDPQSTLIYSIALPVVLLSSSVFWRASDDLRSFSATLTCAAILLAFVYLYSILPMRDRTLGWITPNLLGHFGFAVFVLSRVSKTLWRNIFGLFALSLLIFSESRSVFVSFLIFCALYYVVVPRIKSGGTGVGAMLVFAWACIIAVPLAVIWSDLIIGALSSALNVTDSLRTGSSGFSGREVYWSNALDMLLGHEFGGYGFRTRGETTIRAVESVSAHSGVLNALLDGGIVGLAVLALLYFLSVRGSGQEWIRERSPSANMRFSYLLAMLPILAVEPNYLSFAHPTSFLMILMMAAALNRPKIRSGQVRM